MISMMLGSIAIPMTRASVGSIIIMSSTIIIIIIANGSIPRFAVLVLLE